MFGRYYFGDRYFGNHYFGHYGWTDDGGTAALLLVTLPGTFDTILDQAAATADNSATTPLHWGQFALTFDQTLRAILGTDIATLPPGTVTQADLHIFKSGGANGVGSTFTNFRRFTINGITALANWNTKDGTIAWTTGGLSSTTVTNEVTLNYDDSAVHVITGFAGIFNAAIAAGQPILTIMARAVEEAAHFCLRLASSLEDAGFEWYWELAFSQPPGIPTYISPSDGATNQNACGVTLSWNQASRATGYNVYFGTANPPVTNVSPNQPGTTYTTPQLVPATTYYWQIGAINASGETLGAIWSFTTNTALGVATTPSPADGATGVAVNPTFTFTAGAHATGHILYIAQDAPTLIYVPVDPALAAGTTLPFLLAHNTLYHWYIASTEGCTTVNSAVWTFTTATIPGGFPAYPSNPTPADAATNVDNATTDLSWTTVGATAPTGTSVRFATHKTLTSGDIVYNGVFVTTIPVPVTLAYGTTYYWQVVNTKDGNSAPGPLWTFTVENDPNPPITGEDSAQGKRNRIRPFKRDKRGFGQSAT